VRLTGIVADITERKQAEAKLNEVHKQLLETSRRAGMAEVATGVLHNVGNVLNSVSVSATVVCDRLRQSEIDDIRAAAVMLEDKNGGLAKFLTDDPKGKLIPEYLAKASKLLASERDELVSEMAGVVQHIEHIKEIVAMQQTYAKVFGVLEPVAPAALVLDALRINAAAFERHGVRVLEKFDQDVPPALVDRHKVLQILVNLLRNAKYALDEQSPAEKRIEIHVSQTTSGNVAIAVRDNGIGVAPENLTRIFGHGFTTKKDGHGFGLHSGALAAKQMNGSLTVHSDGLAKGATFILELPIAGPAEQTPAKSDTALVARN
jgi:C4-dicarboxylate-specific signal transduction histidine kinase